MALSLTFSTAFLKDLSRNLQHTPIQATGFMVPPFASYIRSDFKKGLLVLTLTLFLFCLFKNVFLFFPNFFVLSNCTSNLEIYYQDKKNLEILHTDKTKILRLSHHPAHKSYSSVCSRLGVSPNFS